MLGCGPSRLSSSRTTHAQADPTRAETRSHERTMAHQPYAEGNISRADDFPYDGARTDIGLGRAKWKAY